MYEYHFVSESNTVKAYDGKEVIAVLKVDTDMFEAQVPMPESHERYHYDEMVKELNKNNLKHKL